MIVTAVDAPNIKRRLTCILATEAVGYSSHMARDADGAAAYRTCDLTFAKG